VGTSADPADGAVGDVTGSWSSGGRRDDADAATAAGVGDRGARDVRDADTGDLPARESLTCARGDGVLLAATTADSLGGCGALSATGDSLARCASPATGDSLARCASPATGDSQIGRAHV